jgi:hypothetical protein
MFTDKSNIIAVVGVSQDKSKYGYRVYKTLRDNGFKAYAINPKYDEVDGDKIFHKIEDIPEKVTLVVTVAPRAVTMQTAMKCSELGIPRIWMQPGTESPEAVEYCRDVGIEVRYKECIIADGLKMPFTS